MRNWEHALATGRPRAALLLLACSLAITVALILEGAGSPAARELPAIEIPHGDKLLHFAAHALLAGVTMLGVLLLARPRNTATRILVAAGIALAASLLIGISVELVQAGPGAAYGREFDPWDIAANAAGAIAAVLGGIAVARRALRTYTGRGNPAH
jgi:hypothetical protein